MHKKNKRLFPTVLRSAAAGDEQLSASHGGALTSEHRAVEKFGRASKPEGQARCRWQARPRSMRLQVMCQLRTTAHAQFQEQAFATVANHLGRNSNHMPALRLVAAHAARNAQVAGYIAGDTPDAQRVGETRAPYALWHARHSAGDNATNNGAAHRIRRIHSQTAAPW